MRKLALTMIALALGVLALTPAAAFAHHEDDHEQGEQAEQQEANRHDPDDGDDEAGEGQERSSQVRAQQADPDGDAGNEDARNEDAPHGNAHGQEEGETPRGQDGDGTARDVDVDADGNEGVANRGSVKISDGTAVDEHPDNEPHVGCDFSIDYFGFDGGDRAFEIWLQPPTGADVLVHSGVTSLEDARGSELSGSEPVTFEVLNAGGELTEDNRHDQQGWHLKAIVAGADGDTEGPKKSKVFWVDCPTGDVAGFGFGEESQEQVAAVAGVTLIGDEQPVVEDAEAVPDVGAEAAAETAVLGIQFEREEDRAAPEAAPAELARTGADVTTILAAAVLLLLAGGLLLRQARAVRTATVRRRD